MKKKIIWLFYLLFAICFTFTAINIILHNTYYKALHLICVTTICLVGLTIIYKNLSKNEKFIEKNYNKILISFGIGMFIIEIVLGIALRYDPLWDVGAIHKGAIEWVETGTFENYYEYFYRFPNNLAAMAFLHLFFKIASIFGIKDYFAVSVVINSIMVSCTTVIVSLICKKIADVKHAVFALVLFGFSVQFYFLGGAVYTDMLSVMFPVLFFYLYLNSKEQSGKRKIITYILMGLTITIGSLNKFTVIIIAIAVGIDLLINRKFKEFTKILVSVVSIMMIFNVTFNLYMYSSHLDRQTAKGENTPYNHWVMMGLKGDGVYNPEDYEFTRKYDYDENRNSKINKEIFDRIKKLGFCGVFDLAMTKSTADFGNGTYGAEDFYNCNPQTNTKLHDWILPEGKNYKKYATYATSMHIAILILMLTAAWGFVCSDDEKRKKMFSLYLTIFGVYLFLLCCETNRRYFSNFAPVIFICGTLGIDKFIEVCLKTKEKIKCGLK